jgi:hypothetical protein
VATTGENQVIIFDGVDLVTGFTNQNDLISSLFTAGKLITD